VGLARSRTELLSGSSGGFSSSLELIDFHLETGPRGKELAPQISLAVESTRLDVTNRRVTDCAIPCYFAACMIGGADPPGTFKPCMRVRVEASATAGEFRQELSLVNAAGQTLYSSGGPTGGGDVVRYFQVPLYSAPNQALPTGTYRLVSRVVQGSQEMASSALAIELQ
jgi:hypothetical protein